MARLPEEGLTVICLSNMPAGDAEGKALLVPQILLEKSASTVRAKR